MASAAITVFALLLASCASRGPAPPVVAGLPVPDSPDINLVRADLPLRIELPPGSRPGLPLQPEQPCSPFEAQAQAEGVQVWRSRLPTRVPSVSRRAPPAGWQLHIDDQSLPYDARRVAGSWFLMPNWLLVRTAEGAPAPDADACRLTMPGPVAAENARNLDVSGMEAAQLALTPVDFEGQTAVGLFLPSPATATWDLTIPPDARLSLDLRLLPPLIFGGRSSDGADLLVEVDAGDGYQSAGQVPVENSWAAHQVDLSAWSGQQVSLRLRSDPRAHSDKDYVFISEPRLFTPGDDARRVVMIFIDTLRADRLGVYGYDRPTSPAIDAWAEDATVFTQARSIAPWTLPSVKTALSGLQPGQWAQAKTLASRLAGAGFAVESIAGNTNMTPSFGMARDWSRMLYMAPRQAAPVVDQGLEILERRADQDVVLMLHFMDTHLPYDEPDALRDRWAGPHPDGLPGAFIRKDLLSVDASDPQTQPLRDYVSDRYDQTIANVDAELARLFAVLDDDDIVLLFSDHGEEFWDHGGFEHGHALYDEVVRIPFVLKAPGLPPGPVDTAVSLLDLTPSLLDLLGLPPVEDSPGRAVRALLAEELPPGPTPLGWILYGSDAWGVVHQDHKWLNRAGEQELYDLVADPGEHTDLSEESEYDAEPWQAALGQAMDDEMVDVWHVRFTGPVLRQAMELELVHPQGFTSHWLGYDPRGERPLTITERSDGLLLNAADGNALPRDLYLEPGDSAASKLVLRARSGKRELELQVDDDHPDGPLLKGRLRRTRITITHDHVPRPAGENVGSMDPDAMDALRALGYVD